MNLLWVAKLFMSLVTKFLHASIPSLASGPKSNSAWRNTHARAYTPFFSPPNPANYSQRCTHRHSYTHWAISICVSQFTNPYLIGRKGEKCLVQQVWLLWGPKTRIETSWVPRIWACQGASGRLKFSFLWKKKKVFLFNLLSQLFSGTPPVTHSHDRSAVLWRDIVTSFLRVSRRLSWRIFPMPLALQISGASAAADANDQCGTIMQTERAIYIIS